MAAELGDADVEGDSGPGRGSFEDQRDAEAGEALRPEPAALAARVVAGFEGGGAVEQPAELEGAELFAGEEVPLQGGDTTRVPSPTPARPTARRERPWS